MTILGLILFGFILGSVPFGYLAGKIKGTDIREKGSGNIGATNVIRCLGWKWGVPVFMLDMLKGYLPVAIAFMKSEGSGLPPDILAALTGFAAVLGHNFTPFLKFKGGKGVAASAGVLLALMPLSFGPTIAIWAIVFAITRYISVASLSAALALPIITAILYIDRLSLIVIAAILGIFAFLRHHENIRRLHEGKELRISEKPKDKNPEPPK